jgi:hypothetical protein
MVSWQSFAAEVLIPGISTPLCGIVSTQDSSERLSLRQYLSHFTIDDLDVSSLQVHLDYHGHPCIRPVIRYTSVSLIHRVVELGYAEWDSESGMLDLDTWIISLMEKSIPAKGQIAVLEVQSAQVQSANRNFPSVPWKPIVLGMVGINAFVVLTYLGRLSSLLTRRTSIASVTGSSNRAKIRGIAIPTNDALLLPSTDIQAIAYVRTTEKYCHNGWQKTEAFRDQAMCSIDDGTGCLDIDLTRALVHFNKRVAIYNGIPGDLKGRTPYVDDVITAYQYIPVGAVVTLVGTFEPSGDGFRATRNVNVYDGDERSEVLAIKIRVVLCVGVLLGLIVLLIILR